MHAISINFITYMDEVLLNGKSQNVVDKEENCLYYYIFRRKQEVTLNQLRVERI